MKAKDLADILLKHPNYGVELSFTEISKDNNTKSINTRRFKIRNPEAINTTYYKEVLIELSEIKNKFNNT